jgi:hypothetical protein
LKYCGVKNPKPVDSSLLEKFNIDMIEHNGIRQHFSFNRNEKRVRL